MPGEPDAQVFLMSVALLRFESLEGETPAKLVLISILRKRLCSLPGELVADAMWRVRLHNKLRLSGAANRLLSGISFEDFPMVHVSLRYLCVLLVGWAGAISSLLLPLN